MSEWIVKWINKEGIERVSVAMSKEQAAIFAWELKVYHKINAWSIEYVRI